MSKEDTKETKSSQEILAEIMLREEARKIKEREDQNAARQLRVESRHRQDEDTERNLKARQRSCDHRKGTSGSGPKARQIDYNVYAHRFVNGQTMVKCNKCGMDWRNGDTAEFLFRNGEKLPNHTGKSFAEAYEMTLEGNTTNKPSSAETWVTPAAPLVAA